MDDATQDPAAAALLAAYIDAADAAERLTAADEARLARMISKGRRAEDSIGDTPFFRGSRIRKLRRSVREASTAREQLVACNRRIVVPIAEGFSGRGMDLIQLIQEGNLGLIQAVEQFDFRKATGFSTQADFWIRKAIVRALLLHPPGQDGAAGVREPRNPIAPVDSAATDADPDRL